MSGQDDNTRQISGGDLAAVMLENKLLRLLLQGYEEQATLLAGVIDESVEEVRVESDPRFTDLRRLRDMYHAFQNNPDEAELSSMFDELSSGLARADRS